jgi:hypothetical protein
MAAGALVKNPGAGLANRAIFVMLTGLLRGGGSFPGTMMSFQRLIAVALLAFSSTVLLGVGAFAEPLEKAECAGLQMVRKQLLTHEMQAALDRGPDWVKDHLNHAEIERVREFLAVEEKLVFRCRGGGVQKPLPIAMPMPDRNPNRPSQLANVTPSQTVADSDKTAPPQTTRASR